MKSGIYLIRNKVAPIYYIGQSAWISRRWATHRHALNSKLSPDTKRRRVNRRLWMSWNKHGPDCFEFRVLEECSIDALTEREAFWLDQYRGRYPGKVCNSLGPCDNPMRGTTHSLETKLKMSAASKALVRTALHRKRIGDAHRGKIMSAEQRAKISARRSGTPMPSIRGMLNPSHRPEHKARMSGLNNPVHLPGIRERIGLANSKPVTDIKTGDVWPSMLVCAASIGCSVAAVSAHIKKQRKSCMGRTLRTSPPDPP